MSDYDKNETKASGPSAYNHSTHEVHDEEVGVVKSEALKKDLKGRHMQMIAIGGAIGAGLFIGSGGALSKGGPAALIIGYMIVGIMLLFTMQALAELSVLYPVNGAFYTYVVRFLDPAWGFAMGWDYAIAWLTVLPFELIAASITIKFWNESISMGVWVTVFLVALTFIQVFGIKGYGEVEFVLSMVKICACVGFIILGIVINCGGVGEQGYIGVKYWHDPGAFHNGFNGFCAVFVVAAFAFGGTELVGLAAAESENPRKAIPRAAKQVFFRIFLFYVVNLFVLGLILPSNDDRLLNSHGANSKASPFVLAIQDAGIKVLPSIFNAVITVSVISVANSCTFGSTRTIQAMATRKMAPSFFSYVDKAGRPLYCVALQLCFGFLAYIGLAAEGMTIFNWLLSLTARVAVPRLQPEADPLPTPFGIWGSYIGLGLNILCLLATFYNALYPSPTATPNVEDFMQSYLALPLVLLLTLGWKIKSGDWSLYVKVQDMDLLAGARLLNPEDMEEQEEMRKGPWYSRVLHALF
ncbi:putative GAP1-General amino acid permease [Apiospora rasikravindrae]|uniref:GAP1-General amino acid permease n=1 Tax=Apiospora rasikravindrae TaxID=990691 RepID=A0ABR1T7Q9_9PEZI